MRIGLLCATRRGLRFLETLSELAPTAELLVFSFPEESCEPRYLEDIRMFTESHRGKFVEARKVGGPRWAHLWDSNPVDLLFAVSWRYLIPATLYSKPRFGTFIFHDSLLPRYRGFAPTVWSIINGEDHSGVTLFEVAEEVDSGDIVDQQRVPIGLDDTIAEVFENVTAAYLELLRRNLTALMDGTAPRRRQCHAEATYTCKRIPEDNQIDWTAPATSIYNLVRAVTAPYPGAFTSLEGRLLRIWSARRLEEQRRYTGRIAGRVIDVRPGQGAVVATGDGLLLIDRVQPEGGEIMAADAILKNVSQTLGR